MSKKELVLAATTELFDNRDFAAADKYWSSAYVEHSLWGGTGLDGLRAMASSCPIGSGTRGSGYLARAAWSWSTVSMRAWALILRPPVTSGESRMTRSSNIGTDTSPGWLRTRRVTR